MSEKGNATHPHLPWIYTRPQGPRMARVTPLNLEALMLHLWLFRERGFDVHFHCKDEMA